MLSEVWILPSGGWIQTILLGIANHKFSPSHTLLLLPTSRSRFFLFSSPLPILSFLPLDFTENALFPFHLQPKEVWGNHLLLILIAQLHAGYSQVYFSFFTSSKVFFSHHFGFISPSSPVFQSSHFPSTPPHLSLTSPPPHWRQEPMGWTPQPPPKSQTRSSTTSTSSLAPYTLDSCSCGYVLPLFCALDDAPERRRSEGSLCIFEQRKLYTCTVPSWWSNSCTSYLMFVCLVSHPQRGFRPVLWGP